MVSLKIPSLNYTMRDIHFRKIYHSDFLKALRHFQFNIYFYSDGLFYFSVQPLLVQSKQLALTISCNEGN